MKNEGAEVIGVLPGWAPSAEMKNWEMMRGILWSEGFWTRVRFPPPPLETAVAWVV